MAMPYKTGFDFSYKDDFDFGNSLEIPSDCSFSQGCTLETSSKYAHDFSKTSQSIVRCIRPQAKTYSISYNLFYPETADIFAELNYIDGCIGKVGHLYFCNIDFGLCIILSAAVSLNVDSASLVSSASVTLNISEGREPAKKVQYNSDISTNRLPEEAKG